MASSIRDSTGTNETVTSVKGRCGLITRQQNGYILTATLTEFHCPVGINILSGGLGPMRQGPRYLRLYSRASQPAFPPHASVSATQRPDHNLTTSREIPRTGQRTTLENRPRQTLPEYPAPRLA